MTDRKAIKELAKKGRFGDNQLLHVSGAEISGIEKLIGRKLPRNPDTGAKEAFFFLPFLSALLAPAAAAAPVAAAALPAAATAGTGLAAGAAGALGTGLATGLGAATGLGTTAAGLGAAALPAAEVAATALPTAASAALPAAVPAASGLVSLPGAAMGTSGAMAAASPWTAATAAAPEIAAGAAPGAVPGIGSYTAATAPLAQAAPAVAEAGGTGLGAGIGSATSQAALEAAAGAPAGYAAEGGAGILGGLDMNSMMLPMMMLSQMGMGGGGGGGGDDEDEAEAEANVAAPYKGASAKFPGSDYDPGRSPEWKYFGKGGMVKNCYANGGVVNPLYQGLGATQAFNFNAPYAPDPNVGEVPVGLAAMQPQANPNQEKLNGLIAQHTLLGNKMERAAPGGGNSGRNMAAHGWARQLVNVGKQIQGLGGSMPMSAGPQAGIAQGIEAVAAPTGGAVPKAPAKVKKFAEGGQVQGIAALPTGPQPLPQNSPPMAPPADPGTIPQSPYPKEQIGSTKDNDQALIAETVQAIRGQHPDPNTVLMAFVKEFGENALKDLVTRVRGLGASASAGGDGLSDSIPAMIDGQQPAALSDGEYVVPSDVVAHLGNGSTEAGAKQLDGMRDRVREARTGSAKHPPAIDPMMMMQA